MKFYYTYVLLSDKDEKFYIGYTTNLKKRYQEHITGKVFSTKGRLPMKLIYYEACLNKEDALRRERYFKTTMGRRFLKVRIRKYLAIKLIQNCPTGYVQEGKIRHH